LVAALSFLPSEPFADFPFASVPLPFFGAAALAAGEALAFAAEAY
jgi:hypothetical protein